MTKGAYTLPTNIDAPRTKCVFLCIPDDPGHIAAFWGQMLELSRWWAWERDDDHNGTLAAQVWSEVYNDARECWDMSENGCEFNLAGMAELLAAAEAIAQAIDDCCTLQGAGTQIIIDDHRTNTVNNYYDTPTTIHRDTPDTTYTVDSGDDPADLAQREQALCYAIQRYTDAVIDDAWRTWKAGWGLAIAGVGLAFLPAMPAVAVLIAFALLADYTDDVFSDTDARKAVRCCMYTSLHDAAINHTSFESSVNDCGFDFGSHEAQLAYIVNTANADAANWLEFVRAVGEAWTAAQVVSFGTGDCDCSEPDQLDFDFGDNAGTPELQGWLPTEGTIYEVFKTLDHDQLYAELDTEGEYRIFAPGENSDPNGRFGAYREFSGPITISDLLIQKAGGDITCKVYIALWLEGANVWNQWNFWGAGVPYNDVRTYHFDPPITIDAISHNNENQTYLWGLTRVKFTLAE